MGIKKLSQFLEMIQKRYCGDIVMVILITTLRLERDLEREREGGRWSCGGLLSC